MVEQVTHLYVQRVRDAVAEVYCRQQEEHFRKLIGTGAFVYVSEISTDETEQSIQCLGSQSPEHIAMFHAKATLVPDVNDTADVHDYIVPPAVLANQTAGCLLSAIEARVGGLIWPEALAAHLTVFILNTDSHKAMKRMGIEFARRASSLCWFVHCFCSMHMLASCMVRMLHTFQLICDMFCATCVMHRASHRRMLRAAVRSMVVQRMDIVFEEPPGLQEGLRYNTAMLEILELAEQTNWSEHVDAEDPFLRSKRHVARRKLLAFFPCKWSRGARLVHWCRPRCECRSREHSIKSAQELLETAYVDTLPRIPAMNRWTKLFQPIVWWVWALGFCGLIADAFQTCIVSVENEDVGDSLENMLIGNPDDTTIFKFKARVRFRRAVKWLSDSTTHMKLVAAALVMRPSMEVMGVYFDASKVQRSKGSVIPFCHIPTSPATRLLRTYLGMVADMQHEHWTLIAESPEGWSDLALVVAAKPLYTAIGEVYLKNVRPYLFWPWPFGKMASVATTTAEEEALCNSYDRSCPLCGDTGVYKQVNILYPTSQELKSPAGRARIAATFRRVPGHNIACEDRFARLRKHVQASFGMHPKVATLASNHVLSEADLQHDIACQIVQREGEDKERLNPTRHYLPHANCTVEVKQWRSFVKKHVDEFKTLGALSQYRKTLTTEEYEKDVADVPETTRFSSDLPKVFPVPRSRTPWGIGDTKYPVHESIIHGCSNDLSDLASLWTRRVSDAFDGTALAEEREDIPCCRVFGVGRCCTTETVATQRRLAGLVSLLKRFASCTNAADLPECSPTAKMHLLVHFHDAASRLDIVVKRIACMKTPQMTVFYNCIMPDGGLQPGSLVRVCTDGDVLDHLACHQKLALQLLDQGVSANTIRYSSVRYHYVALDVMRVTDVEDIMGFWIPVPKPRTVGVLLGCVCLVS